MNKTESNFKLKCYDDDSMIFLHYNATSDPTCQNFIEEGPEGPYHVKNAKCTKVPGGEGFMLWNIDNKENVEIRQKIREEEQEEYRNKLSSAEEQTNCTIDTIQMFHDSNCRLAFSSEGYKDYPTIPLVNEWMDNRTCVTTPEQKFIKSTNHLNTVYKCVDNLMVLEHHLSTDANCEDESYE